VVNFTTVACRISSRLKLYKNYKNRLRLAKVIVKNKMSRLLWFTVYKQKAACIDIINPCSNDPLHTLGTHYHPMLDPAILWTPSNDTSRPTCSESFNLMPPAPLHLRTLWCYTNAVIIIRPIIIIINPREWQWQSCLGLC